MSLPGDHEDQKAVDSREDMDGNVAFASATMRGRRYVKADRATVKLGLDSSSGERSGTAGNALFFVADGHQGFTAAEYASEVLPERLVKSDDYRSGRLASALSWALLSIDEDLVQGLVPSREGEQDAEPSAATVSGTTATAALLCGNKLIVAHVGDSRAILIRNGQVVPMTTDHCPFRPDEWARIKAARGWVSPDGKLCHQMRTSRALGRREAKNQHDLLLSEHWLTGVPDLTVAELQLTEHPECLVLVSNGVWMPCAPPELMYREHLKSLDRITLAKALNRVLKGGKYRTGEFLHRVVDELDASEVGMVMSSGAVEQRYDSMRRLVAYGLGDGKELSIGSWQHRINVCLNHLRSNDLRQALNQMETLITYSQEGPRYKPTHREQYDDLHGLTVETTAQLLLALHAVELRQTLEDSEFFEAQVLTAMETAEKEERMAAIVAAQDFLNAIPPSEGRAVMEEIQRFATLSYPVVPTEAHLITFMWEQSQSELVRMLASSALRHAIDTVWGWVNRLSVLCEDPRVTCPGTDGPSEELGPAKKFLKSLDPVWLGMVLDGVHTMTATQPLGPGWAEVVDGLDPWQLKSVVEGGGLSEKERYRLHQRKEAHSNRNLCNLIQRCIGASPIASLSKVCERVLHFCYDDLNGDDDMAIILVAVLPDGWTLADWFNWMKTGGGEP